VVLVGIGGGTGAGKTSIVRGVVERLGGRVLDLDSYYRDRSHLGLGERQLVNYDEPDAIEIELLLQHLSCLAGGRSVQKPIYSFEAHGRVGVGPVAAARLILVDGLFTLWWPALRARLDLKIFVDAPADMRLARRLRRDVAERGRSFDDVLRQYLGTVRPMHERYVEPTRTYADLVVMNEEHVDGCVLEVATAIVATARTKGGAEDIVEQSEGIVPMWSNPATSGR
jgi:uridine kinase